MSTAAMRLRVHDPDILPDLLAFLEGRVDVVVSQVGDDELEVSLLASMHVDAHRLELELRVRAWEEAHRVAAGSVEVVN